MIIGVTALSYGYTHKNGSQIIFDDSGKIIGVEDEILLMSRYPIEDEIKLNDYIPASLGECLTSKGAIFYGAWWCPHCNNQHLILGDEDEKVNYVECSTSSRTQKEICNKVGIKAYPTWYINGKYYEGELSLEKLSEISSCPLN